MKKLEDVGVLVARILMPILFITAGWGQNHRLCGNPAVYGSHGRPGRAAAADHPP